MVAKVRKVLIETDRYKIFIVIISLLATTLLGNITFSINRALRDLDKNTTARTVNEVVDSNQTLKIQEHSKKIVHLEKETCELKKEAGDLGNRISVLEIK